jgi:two-component system chemotaxis response regulator CheB
MPRKAIEHVDADYIVPVQEIGRTLSELAVNERTATEVSEAMERTLLETQCPECSGPLWEERQGKVVEYRCRVGHTFSPLTLQAEQEDAIEKALWTSIINLENARLMADKLQSELGPDEEAGDRRAQTEAIRGMLKLPGTPKE